MPDDSAWGLSSPDRLRLSLAGSSTHTDRIEFTTAPHTGSLSYGLDVLVTMLPTPHCCDAVSFPYRTIPHRTKWTLTTVSTAFSGALGQSCRSAA